MIDQQHPLVLGSASPRRRELLGLVGIPVTVVAAPVDERVGEGEEPAAYLQRIVAVKLAAARQASLSLASPGVLVADTIVLLDGEVLGKPENREVGAAMLTRLSGRAHEVRTRFALRAAAGLEHAQTVSTAVFFRQLSADEIARYAASGDGLDKAGGYAIQGLGSFAVTRIEGSYANVVGLPVCEVVVALKRLGLLSQFP